MSVSTCWVLSRVTRSVPKKTEPYFLTMMASSAAPQPEIDLYYVPIPQVHHSGHLLGPETRIRKSLSS